MQNINPIQDNFWGILRESILVQAIITLMCVATVCVMWIQGLTPPVGLVQIVSIVLGFYFGSKSNSAAQTTMMKAAQLIATPIKANIEIKKDE